MTIEPNPLVAADAARAEMAKKLQPLPGFSPQVAAEGTGRDSLPESSAEPKFALPPIQRAKLANGMQVLLVEKHQLPAVTLNVVFPVGKANDGKDMAGLADMTAAVWDEGTTKRTAEDIAAQLGDIGASLSISADWNATSVRLFSLKRHLPRALDILVDVLRDPTFPKAELHRQQLATLARLSQLRNEPTALASLATWQSLYGGNHPYGRAQGNPAAIKALKPEDLKHFYASWIRPERATVIAVGDITLAELNERSGSALGDWKSAAPAPPEPDYTVPAQRPTSVVLIDKPHAAQSVIQVSLIGSCRNTPDFFPQNVMNTALGGQFFSRLNLNLREQKGYTYGARTVWDWRARAEGPYIAVTSVQTNVTAPAVAEILKELHDIAVRGPSTPRSLTSARNTSRGATRPASRRPRNWPGNWRTCWPTTCPTTISTRSCRAFRP